MFALRLVVVGDHGGLRFVDVDPVADHPFVTVVGTAALLAAQQQAFDQFLVGHFERKHDAYRRTVLLHDLVEGFGLHGRAREAVEDVAFGVFVFRHIVGDDVDHQAVGGQLSLLDVALYAAAQLGAFANLFADDFAGGNVVESVFFDEFLGLGSFSRTRRAEQYEVEHGGK